MHNGFPLAVGFGIGFPLWILGLPDFPCRFRVPRRFFPTQAQLSSKRLGFPRFRLVVLGFSFFLCGLLGAPSFSLIFACCFFGFRGFPIVFRALPRFAGVVRGFFFSDFWFEGSPDLPLWFEDSVDPFWAFLQHFLGVPWTCNLPLRVFWRARMTCFAICSDLLYSGLFGLDRFSACCRYILPRCMFFCLLAAFLINVHGRTIRRGLVRCQK